MSSYVRRLWKDNHGGWLLSVAAAACLVVGIIWRLDLIPDFDITRSPKSPLLSQTITSQNSILVAQINAPVESADVRGYILLFPPDGDPLQPPSFQQTFQLDARGMTTVLMVLPPGTYKAIAFLDLNNNGQLDFEDTNPLEPMQMPGSPGSKDSGQNQTQLEVALAPQVSVFRTFEF